MTKHPQCWYRFSLKIFIFMKIQRLNSFLWNVLITHPSTYLAYEKFLQFLLMSIAIQEYLELSSLTSQYPHTNVQFQSFIVDHFKKMVFSARNHNQWFSISFSLIVYSDATNLDKSGGKTPCGDNPSVPYHNLIRKIQVGYPKILWQYIVDITFHTLIYLGQ